YGVLHLMLFSSILLIFQSDLSLNILMTLGLKQPKNGLERFALNKNYNPLPIDLKSEYYKYLADSLLHHLNYLIFLRSCLDNYSLILTFLYNTSALVFFLSYDQINIECCVHN